MTTVSATKSKNLQWQKKKNTISKKRQIELSVETRKNKNRKTTSESQLPPNVPSVKTAKGNTIKEPEKVHYSIESVSTASVLFHWNLLIYLKAPPRLSMSLGGASICNKTNGWYYWDFIYVLQSGNIIHTTVACLFNVLLRLEWEINTQLMLVHRHFRSFFQIPISCHQCSNFHT